MFSTVILLLCRPSLWTSAEYLTNSSRTNYPYDAFPCTKPVTARPASVLGCFSYKTNTLSLKWQQKFHNLTVCRCSDKCRVSDHARVYILFVHLRSNFSDVVTKKIVYLTSNCWTFCTEKRANVNTLRKKKKYRLTQKNGNFWKTQQKLKKSKKKNYLQKLELLQLAF